MRPASLSAPSRERARYEPAPAEDHFPPKSFLIRPSMPDLEAGAFEPAAFAAGGFPAGALAAGAFEACEGLEEPDAPCLGLAPCPEGAFWRFPVEGAPFGPCPFWPRPSPPPYFSLY